MASVMFKKKLKKLFIPHKGNKFRPDFLERTSMGIMLVLVVCTFAIANIQSLIWISSEWMVSSVLPAVIVELTNEERTDGNVGMLKRSSILDDAARMKAEDMVQNSYFAHYSPTGVSPWHWFDEASYNFVHAGENLAVHFTDSGEVVDAWMDSPTHRANIMNNNFTEIGVGTAKGRYKGESTIFVVQLFGTPSVVRTEKVALVPETEVVKNADILGEVTTVEENKLTEEVPPVVVEEVQAFSATQSFVPETDKIDDTVVETAINPTDGTKVMYSDLSTTSREGVPATAGAITGDDESSTNVFERTMTQPSMWLQVVYGILSLIVLIALLVSIVIEWRRQNPIQIAYAGSLLAIMALLLHIHILFTSQVVIM